MREFSSKIGVGSSISASRSLTEDFVEIRVRFSKRSLHDYLADAMGGSWVKIL